MKSKQKRLLLIQRGRRIGKKRIARRKAVRKKRLHLENESLQKVEIKRKYVRRKSGRHWKKLSMPDDFCLISNYKAVLIFIRDVESAFNDPETKGIIIDHSPLQKIGIEACLILVAEFQRQTTYAPAIQLKGNIHCIKPEVGEILRGVGYFSFYDDRQVERKCPQDNARHYTEIKSGIGSDSVASGTLVESFTNYGHLDQRTGARLGKCLVECLDNVSHHAYANARPRSLKKRWWLVGYCNKETRELYFAILDLGIGMPASLKRRKREFGMEVGAFLIGRSDEELIVEAFSRSFSSTKRKNRGLGLPGLKRIIDAAGSGELRVFSWASECLLRPGVPPKGISNEIPLNGTILIWKVHSGSFSSAE